jgi:hypothetical protein
MVVGFRGFCSTVIASQMLRMLGSLASCLFGCYGLEPSWITYEFEFFFQTFRRDDKQLWRCGDVHKG